MGGGDGGRMGGWWEVGIYVVVLGFDRRGGMVCGRGVGEGKVMEKV